MACSKEENSPLALPGHYVELRTLENLLWASTDGEGGGYLLVYFCSVFEQIGPCFLGNRKLLWKKVIFFLFNFFSPTAKVLGIHENSSCCLISTFVSVSK